MEIIDEWDRLDKDFRVVRYETGLIEMQERDVLDELELFYPSYDPDAAAERIEYLKERIEYLKDRLAWMSNRLSQECLILLDDED